MTYEIVTVDYIPEQTRVWRHWVNKNCPGVKVHTIPDRRPFRRCWSGAKIECWMYGFEGRRIIYLDTDTIVTRDMEEVFDLMGDAKIAASTELKQDRLKRKFPEVVEELRTDWKRFRIYNPPNTSSGMVVLKDFDPELFFGMWAEVMEDPIFGKKLLGHYTSEEYALSLAIARNFPIKHFWSIPHRIHGNVFYRKTNFGGANPPMVIHYHKPLWLMWLGMEEYLLDADHDALRRRPKTVSSVQPGDGETGPV